MKRLLSVLLSAVIVISAFVAMDVTSFAAGSLQTQISELENQIAQWEDSIAWYENHRGSTAGLEKCVGAKVVQKNPLILHGSGLTNAFSGYIHITNPSYTEDHFTLLGFTGYVRSLGYSTMTYNGYTVWEYELVETEQYTTEISNLKAKISSAESKLNSLKNLESKYDRIDYYITVNDVRKDYIRLNPKSNVYVQLNNRISATGIESVTWSSSDTRVATVSEGATINPKGYVTAKKGGIAVVTATGDTTGLSASITVKVAIPSTEITLKKDKINLSCGRKYTIKAALAPKNSNDYIQYLSSDETVATVSSKGVITAKNPGTAYIAVMAESGVYKVLTVKVLQKNAPNPTTEYLAVKAAKEYHEERIDAERICHYIAEKNKTKYIVTAHSFEENIKSYISAMQTNSDTYYVSSYSPTYTYSISKGKLTKKVVNGISYTGDYSPARSVKISDDAFWDYWDGTNGSYRYNIKINENIHFSVNASNSIGEKAFWSSSNEYVATVDENGVVTGLRNGTAEITCTMEGGKKDTQKITVGIPKILDCYNNLGWISLNVSEKMRFGSLGDEGNWTSSKPNVASVSADGEVTALSEGFCTISFTRVDGLKGSVDFYIIDEDKDYYGQYIYLKKGDSLYCPTLAENLANKKTNVLSCDPDGTIHAIESGDVVLHIPFVDGETSGTSEITIRVLEG